MMNVRIFLSLLVLVVLLGTTAYGDRVGVNEMRLKIQLSKETYLLGEPVMVLTIFENVTDQAITFNTAYNVWPECSLTFKIISPSGKRPTETLPLLGKRGLLNKKDFIKINPGERFEVQTDVSKWYRLEEKGVYTISAEYMNKETGKDLKSLLGRRINAWIGHVISEPRSFNLMEEAEDKRANEK